MGKYGGERQREHRRLAMRCATHVCDICAGWTERDRQSHGYLLWRYREAGKHYSAPGILFDSMVYAGRALRDAYEELVAWERRQIAVYAVRAEERGTFSDWDVGFRRPGRVTPKGHAKH